MADTVICKDVFGNEYDIPIDDLDVRIGVYAVIIKDNKILLTRQWNGYSIIGGGVEKGETLEEAFVREVEEETGLIATSGKLIHHATTFFKRDEKTPARQSYQFYVTATDIKGKLHNSNITDSEKTYTNDVPEWVNLDTIDKIEFRHSIGLKEILAAYNKAR